MRWFGSSASAAVVLCCLSLLLPGAARADDAAQKPAPRTAVQIGGASLVLIAANDHIYAFVDRLDDNAPVESAELGIGSADGTALQVSKASEGLFIAPFNRAGHMHDAFTVSLRSPEITGDATAEIAYDDLPVGSDGGTKPTFTSNLLIALVSGGIGAIASAMFIFWLRGGRRRTTPGSVGTAQAA